MPVYDHRYRGWDGERLPPRWLFLTLTRLGLAEVFSSKLILILFVASCLPFLVFASIVYGLNSAEVLKLISGSDVDAAIAALEGRLFFWFLIAQSMLAFLVASFAGPNLIGPDIVHGAMPLYLSRPISRADYVLGKLGVLLVLLSAITWVPGLLLAGLQASLAADGWLTSHWQIPLALFVGSWIWILMLSLLALAISAWIRWRPLATSALFIVLVVGSAFGTAVNEMLDTRWGKLLMLSDLATTIWLRLFGTTTPIVQDDPLPLAVCWLGLGAACAAALAILHRKIRAYEVVRWASTAWSAPSDPKTSNGANGSNGERIVFDNVSKFYGEVLGVNRIDLTIGPGITALVGPNGSGKTTLMNLMAGLLRPSEGEVSICGLTPDEPERLFRRVGYCTQFDTFPRGIRGWEFVELYLRLHGYARSEAAAKTRAAIERLGMMDAANRRIAGYSKGMKQRIKLAQAIAHDPDILVLDEPLNGLDPLARAETIDLFRSFAKAGRHLIVSSHVLHEVDDLSDRVVLIHGGYIVAEGEIEGVRGEMAEERPLQVLVRCDRPSTLAARVFSEDHVVEARLDPDKRGVLIRTQNAERFYLLLNRLATEGVVEIEAVLPADDDVQAVYQYLIGGVPPGAG